MKGVLTTSWDDGCPHDMRLAERLAAHGLPATFYVPRQSSLPVIGPTEIRDLQGMGHEIGAHTLAHMEVVACGEDEAREQIVGSKAWIEAVTGRRCSVFCFPSGRFGVRDLRIASQAGFAGVRGVEYLSTEWPRQRHGMFVMATTVQAFSQSPFGVIKNLGSRGRWVRFVLRLPAIIRAREWTRIGVRLAEEVRDRGGVFHLWGHSWEIDRSDSWRDLEYMFSCLAEMFTEDARMSNGDVCQTAAALTESTK